VTGRSSWPWMAAGLAVILLALGLLRDPVPEAAPTPAPAPRMATSAATARAPGMRSPPARAGAPQPDEDGAGERRDDEREEERGATTGSTADNPFAVFLDRPALLSDGAADHPPMESLDVGDDAYDPVIEARQLFAPFEQALVARQPLTPGTYKAMLTDFKDQNMKVLKRADWLRKTGHADDATELMTEWGRMFDHYKAQAYARAPQEPR
jgi:hypothetical protein